MPVKYGTLSYKVGEVNSIERIQKLHYVCALKAGRVAYHAKSWESGYHELLKLFSLPDLQQRRLYLDLSTMLRIVHALFSFPNDVFVH